MCCASPRPPLGYLPHVHDEPAAPSAYRALGIAAPGMPAERAEKLADHALTIERVTAGTHASGEGVGRAPAVFRAHRAGSTRMEGAGSDLTAGRMPVGARQSRAAWERLARGMGATGLGLPSCPVACVPGELGRGIKMGDALPEVPTTWRRARRPGRAIERRMAGRVFICPLRRAWRCISAIRRGPPQRPGHCATCRTVAYVRAGRSND